MKKGDVVQIVDNGKWLSGDITHTHVVGDVGIVTREFPGRLYVEVQCNTLKQYIQEDMLVKVGQIRKQGPAGPRAPRRKQQRRR
jgi:hypothetical protein